jgi:hypothetical protein
MPFPSLRLFSSGVINNKINNFAAQMTTLELTVIRVNLENRKPTSPGLTLTSTLTSTLGFQT